MGRANEERIARLEGELNEAIEREKTIRSEGILSLQSSLDELKGKVGENPSRNLHQTSRTKSAEHTQETTKKGDTVNSQKTPAPK